MGNKKKGFKREAENENINEVEFGGEDMTPEASTSFSQTENSGGGVSENGDGGFNAADDDLPDIESIDASIARVRSEIYNMLGLDDEESSDNADAVSGDANTEPVSEPVTETEITVEPEPEIEVVPEVFTEPEAEPEQEPAIAAEVEAEVFTEQEKEPAVEKPAEAQPAAKKPAKKSGKKKPASKKKKPAAAKKETKPAPNNIIVFEDFGDDETEQVPAVEPTKEVPPSGVIVFEDFGEDEEAPAPEKKPAPNNIIVFEDFGEDEIEEAPAPETKLAPSGVILFEDEDIEPEGMTVFVTEELDESDFDEEDSIFLTVPTDEPPPEERPIIVFEDFGEDEIEETPIAEDKPATNGVIIFEDEEPKDESVVVFEDVDDAYLNQIELVDKRLQSLRKRSGIEDAEEKDSRPQAQGVIEFIDEDEGPLGRDFLDKDVDTLIKKLLAQSKKRAKAHGEKIDDKIVVRASDEPLFEGKMDESHAKQSLEEINDLIKQVGKDHLLYNIYNAACSGHNKLTHSIKSEAIVLDGEWITTIEDGLHFIEDIVKNPRRFLIDEEIIMEVERARKTNSKTVRHLAQNTKNISKIDDDGFVTPKKVLTVEVDEDLAIYENRFICTLVNRLTLFVETRKTEIESKFKMSEISQVTMHSRFKYGRGDVECNFTVAVKEPPKDDVLLNKAMFLMNKINDISKRLRILKASYFVKKLSVLKPVVPPIAKTNIIKMNVNYSTSYKLWLYISSYMFVGYSVEVKEKRLPVDGNYFEDLAAITALSMRSVITHEFINREQYSNVAHRAPKLTKYKVVPEYLISASAKDSEVDVKDEVINEYYFRKIQETMEEKAAVPAPADDEAIEDVDVPELGETASKPNNVITETRKLKINYERFCKSLLQVTNEVLGDTLKKDKDKFVVHVQAVDRKKDEFAEQIALLEKYETISRIKASDLEKSLNEEAKLAVKLERLKRDIEELEAAKSKKGSSKLKPLKQPDLAKKQRVEEKAAKFKEKLTGKMEADRERDAERKLSRKEERLRQKELRELERLKSKYE